jgi:hypothetical protein
MSMIVFQDTELSFDDANGLRFNVDPKKIKLSGVLTFISDLLNKFSGKDSGLSFGLLPDGGIQSILSLPLPDIQLGAFGISNLHVGALLALRLKDARFNNNFSIQLGFNVGRKEAPFALTIFILGGGGFVELESRYAPGSGQLRCTVHLGITVSASLAISLGPIHGGVYVYFGITADLEVAGGAGPGLTIGVMLLIRGEVSILGIVSAAISLLLEAQYSAGKLIGRGRLSISIKICWCFTLEIEEEVTYTIGGGGGESSRLNGDQDRLIAAHHPTAVGYRRLPNRSVSDGHYAALPPADRPDLQTLVADYIFMLT